MREVQILKVSSCSFENKKFKRINNEHSYQKKQFRRFV